MTALASPRPARLPLPVKLAFIAALGLCGLLAPRPARASEDPLAADFKRGPYAEFGWRPALVPQRHGVMPAARTHFAFGARLTPHLTLATMGHATVYFDRGQKPGLGIDALLQLQVTRGFYLRAGAGVISHIPIAPGRTDRTPGYGGQIGLGYAFRLGDKAKGVAMGLGADYDLRILQDRRRRGVLVLGLSLMFG